MPFEYYCGIERIIDGDSLVLTIDLGFNHHLVDAHMRVLGVNTAELRPRSGPQYEDAIEHLNFTAGWAAAGVSDFEWWLDEGADVPADDWPFRVRSYEWDTDSFGRILGTLTRRSDGRELSAALRDEYGEAVASDY